MGSKKENVGVANIVSDKIDFKPTKKKRRTLHTLKESMQQKELIILNIYAPSTGAPRYIIQVINDP